MALLTRAVARQRLRAITIPVALSIFALAGCFGPNSGGTSDGNDSPGNSEAAAVNAALAELNPVTAGPNEAEHVVGPSTTRVEPDPLPDPSAPTKLSRYSCTSTPYSLTTTPGKIVMQNPDSTKLWVGGLLQGDGYAKGPGSLLELPIHKRAPLKIFTDLLGNDVTATVENPDASSVQQTIATLVQTAKADNVPIPSRASYTETEMDNTSEGLLKLGFSANYLGAEASGSLSVKRTAQEHSYLVSFYQRQFTVSMVTPATSADLFSPDFTVDDLEAQKQAGRISEDNPPVVVSSISYGRVLLYSLTSKESTARLEGVLKAAYAGQSAEISGEDQQVLKELQVKAVNIGGREADFESLIKSRKIGDYFSGNSDLATAVPISYQLNNVVGKLQAASFNETTNYNETICAPIPNKATIVGARVRISPPEAKVVGNRNPVWAYGRVTLKSNGSSDWAVDRDHNGTWYKSVPIKLSWDQPDPSQAPWTVDLRFGQEVSVAGSINCKLAALEIGPDPVNEYWWGWSPGRDQYGFNSVAAEYSDRCKIELNTDITKIADLYEYEP